MTKKLVTTIVMACFMHGAMMASTIAPPEILMDDGTLVRLNLFSPSGTTLKVSTSKFFNAAFTISLTFNFTFIKISFAF